MQRTKRLLVFLLLITTFFTLPVSATGETAVRDITYYPDIEAPQHPHIWVYKFDDQGHWKECPICKTITTKSPHNKTPNGGNIDLFSLYWDTAYRDVCNCGWKGPAQRVIPGRPENYPTREYFYDGYRYTKFSDCRPITSSEYTRDYVNSGTKRAKGTVQGYTFSNGYVYGGGLVQANPSYNIKGTVGTIVGYDGYGSRSYQTMKNETSRLVWFYQTQSNRSRSNFLALLPSCGSSHPLYGMYAKYVSMSDYNFNRIMAACAGMSMHGISWGCGASSTDHVSYQSCETPGTHWYSGNCITASGEQMTMFNNYRRNYTCAICNTFVYGDEHLTYIDYYTSRPNSSDGASLAPGTSLRAGNASYTYYLSTSNKVGYHYYNYKRETDNQSYRQLVVVPSSHCSVTDGSGNRLSSSLGYYSGSTFYSNWMLTPINTSSNHLSSYGLDTFAWFHDNQRGGQRQLGGYYWYALQDTTKPTAYGQGNTTYWQLTGNGTKEKTSTQASLKVTFYDALFYPKNLVYARLLESDKKTPILQENGVEWKGLTNISGQQYWRGVFDVSTEVNGTKTIYVQAKDATGNLSAMVPISVSYIDAKGPTLSFGPADVSNGTWSRTKTVTVYGQDAFNNVKIGMSVLKDDPAVMTIVSNDEYNFQRTITFTGNVSYPKDIAIFGQDFSNNLSWYDIVIDKLDNTIPTVNYDKHTCYNGYTNVQLSGADKQTVFQNAEIKQADGSGVKYYGVSKSPDEEPTEWQTSPVIRINETGTYYFWDKDGVDWVSEPTKGIYIPVHWNLYFDYDDPNIASNDMTGNEITEKEVTNKEKIGELPNPAIRGWTFMGWTLWDEDETTRPEKLITYDRQDDYELNTRTRGQSTIDIDANTIYKWSENKTAQAEWRENRYTVVWNDQLGNTYDTGKTYLYDHWYEAPTQEESGFERPGYYIAYWDVKTDGHSEHRFWSKDKDWPVGEHYVDQKFGNLTDIDDGVVTVYAIWKPIPYTIRIWDNYIGTAEPHKDYAVDFETKFHLPGALWDHGDAVALGYDRTAETLVTPEWKLWDTVEGLTYERDSVVDIYTIWDNPPTIECIPEYYLNAVEAATNGLTENNASVTRTNLEAWLLSKCTARDWEWTKRYGSAVVPPGQNRGYTLKVSAFEPVKVVDGAKAGVLQYYVTFEVTDDAGLQATCTMTLYVSDKINILVN